MATIRLGDEVRDRITGFQGVVVAKHTYLEGCARFTVQPPIDNEGKLPESHTFDEVILEVTASQKVKIKIGDLKQTKENHPGGPEKYSDTGRPEDAKSLDI